MNRVTRLLLLWGPVVICLGAIFYVSSLESPPLPDQVSDKTGHFSAYTGLGFLMLRALAGGLPVRVGARLALLTLALTAGYGASDEVHQIFVPGRSAEWGDLLADSTGATVGIVVCWAWGIIAVRRPDTRGAPRHEL